RIEIEGGIGDKSRASAEGVDLFSNGRDQRNNAVCRRVGAESDSGGVGDRVLCPQYGHEQCEGKRNCNTEKLAEEAHCLELLRLAKEQTDAEAGGSAQAGVSEDLLEVLVEKVFDSALEGNAGGGAASAAKVQRGVGWSEIVVGQEHGVAEVCIAEECAVVAAAGDEGAGLGAPAAVVVADHQGAGLGRNAEGARAHQGCECANGNVGKCGVDGGRDRVGAKALEHEGDEVAVGDASVPSVG